MTHRVDVARGRDIVARWCNLAERRLEYLTELFESGRWRRFHSERALLENIREAKAAVETWRDLLRREAALDNSAIDMSWLGRVGAAAAQRETLRDQAQPPRPQPQRVAEPSRPEPRLAAEAGHVLPIEAPSEPDLTDLVPDPALEPVLDISAIEFRYPLLRNAL